MALAECAVELLFLRELLMFLGHDVSDGVVVRTDSKSAYDLCHRFSAAQHTKHIDRKMFKMRELRGSGKVKLQHIPGKTNPADLFTKILPRADFERYRAFILNLVASEGDGVLRARAAAGGVNAGGVLRQHGDYGGHTRPQRTREST